LNATEITALLHRLDLAPQNAGAWSGSHGWADGTSQDFLDVHNPASGERLARVRPAAAQDLERVLESAVAAAARWREVPAPQRGELIRLLGVELRRVKRDLGTLVSLENGKILAEGLGEVQ
jgi:aldehyde dehydrogenase (NAD+)